MDGEANGDQSKMNSLEAELRATVNAYQEQGPTMNPLVEEALLSHFLQRVESAIGEQVDRRVNARVNAWAATQLETVIASRVDSRFEALVDAKLSKLATRAETHRSASAGTVAASFGLGIPLAAIAAGTTGIIGILLVCTLILAVNVLVVLRA